jgi:hypothetical protein
MGWPNEQQRQAVRHGRVPWSPLVVDPRDARGVRYGHLGLLSLLVAAFACGKRGFKEASYVARDVGQRPRRKLGLPAHVDGTTLWRLVAAHSTEGMRETLVAQVRRLLSHPKVAHVPFPLKVLSVDAPPRPARAWPARSPRPSAIPNAHSRAGPDRRGGRGARASPLRAPRSCSDCSPCLPRGDAGGAPRPPDAAGLPGGARRFLPTRLSPRLRAPSPWPARRGQAVLQSPGPGPPRGPDASRPSPYPLGWTSLRRGRRCEGPLGDANCSAASLLASWRSRAAPPGADSPT